MSGKSAKKMRRMFKKFNMKVFKDFTIEVSVMPFWTRFKFCMRMAFLRQPLQKELKPEIEARRKYTADGEEK